MGLAILLEGHTMRLIPIVGTSLLIGLTAASVAAAAEFRRSAFEPPAQPSFLSEFRFGLSAQDPWGPESGTRNLTGEILFAKPFTAADLFTSYFIPRPQIGGSLNVDGKTSFAHAGLSWTVDITQQVFVEGSFGGVVHNGPTGALDSLPKDRAALGCSPLFRESGSVGLRLSANWSLMATVEHLSNGGLCSDNRGLTNVGARLGYSF
jgi:lipid A 3-O-deacylase